MEVLQLDVSGRPQAWISAKEAATLYASDAVAWTVGDAFHVLRGAEQLPGTDRKTEQNQIGTNRCAQFRGDPRGIQ